MSLFIVEIVAGLFSLVILLLFRFYLYPAIKKEWKEKDRDWQYYYNVCGDDNRQTYMDLFRSVLTVVMKKL